MDQSDRGRTEGRDSESPTVVQTHFWIGKDQGHGQSGRRIFRGLGHGNHALIVLKGLMPQETEKPYSRLRLALIVIG
jgi:hypothetical protein